MPLTTPHQLTVERREERERHSAATQVYALTTHQLQVERKASTRAQSRGLRSTTTQLQVERRIESHRANQVECAHHNTSYRWRGEGETLEPIQVYFAHHHQLQVDREERVIVPIKCMRSPHTKLQVERRRGHRAIKVYALPLHPAYRWRGERGHRANQVLCAHHTPVQVERRES